MTTKYIQLLKPTQLQGVCEAHLDKLKVVCGGGHLKAYVTSGGKVCNRIAQMKQGSLAW